jgi:putative NADPH-quinone reductase
MTKRILLIQGHPDAGARHLCHALADAYADGARAAGHEVRTVDVAMLEFPVLRSAEEWEKGTLPAGLAAAQDGIAWAEHLVILFPLWLGDMPALLKGFFDKVFLPGFAFTEADAAPLLTHIQTGTAITTMGAPRPIYTSVEPVLLKGILEFCGVQRTQWFNLADIPNTTPEQRTAWVNEIIEHFRTL